MYLQIKDHVFMVSSGSKGIGFAIAERASREGARTKSTLAEVTKTISDATSAKTHCF